MKKSIFLICSMFLMISSLAVNAQNKTGQDFFKGKWNILFESTPVGDMKMVVVIDQQNEKLVGAILDTTGNQLFNVSSIELNENTATVNFIGSQGMDVLLHLTKKDEDHVDAEIMNMFYSVGERSKAN